MSEAKHTPTPQQAAILRRLAKRGAGMGTWIECFRIPEKRVISRIERYGWCEKTVVTGMSVVLITEQGRAAIAAAETEEA